MMFSYTMNLFRSSFSEYILLTERCKLFSHVDIITYPTIQDGQTALGQASIRGHHNVVEFLLGAGANPDLQDKVGKFIQGGSSLD